MSHVTVFTILFTRQSYTRLIGLPIGLLLENHMTEPHQIQLITSTYLTIAKDICIQEPRINIIPSYLCITLFMMKI